MKIGRAKLTTDHPSSSYGIPVLVLDGVVYGPDDIIKDGKDYEVGMPAGAVMATADVVCGVRGKRLSADAVDALCRWLGQSPDHGVNLIETVRRAQVSPEPEFSDEG